MIGKRPGKLWRAARVIEDDGDLLVRLSDPGYPGKVERAIVFTVEAWDVNCPQHIHPRFTQRQVQPVIEQLQDRIRDLEQELAALRATQEGSSPR